MSLHDSTIGNGWMYREAYLAEKRKEWSELEVQLSKIDDQIEHVHASDYLHLNDTALNVWAERALYTLRNNRASVLAKMDKLNNSLRPDCGDDWMHHKRRRSGTHTVMDWYGDSRMPFSHCDDCNWRIEPDDTCGCSRK